MPPDKKKTVKVEEAVEEPPVVVPAPVPMPPPAPPKEKLLSLRANVFFCDGNLREFFQKYNYPVEWPMNEVRQIPKWLAERCIQSGAELDRADG